VQYDKAIRIVRAARGLSQKALALKLGVDPSYISHLESGARIPNHETVEAVAAALGVPLPLFVFLASGAKRFKGIDPKQAEALGQELLKILFDDLPEESE
jgi:transcriptional regulator with XRE-family HTH domain